MRQSLYSLLLSSFIVFLLLFSSVPPSHPLPPKLSSSQPSKAAIIPHLSISPHLQKMQTAFTLSAGHGLPVSITGGITHRLNISMEIADHERQAEALRRSRESFSPNQEMGLMKLLEKIMMEGVSEDLQLSCSICSRAA